MIGQLQKLDFDLGKWVDVGDEVSIEYPEQFLDKNPDPHDLELGKYRLAVFLNERHEDRPAEPERQRHFWVEKKIRWETWKY